MIIGACGFGETGSGVITDYLKEFDDILVKESLEFTYVTKLDGLLYLERAVMHPFNRTGDSIYAIKRFMEMVEKCKSKYQHHGLSEKAFLQSATKFIDAITTTKWYWTDGRVRFRYKSRYFLHQFFMRKIIPRMEVKSGKRAHCWQLTEVRISVKPENFYEVAKEHMDELLKSMGINQEKTIVLDQPFAANNPQACFPYFKDPYAVVVDRDPRDLYVSGKTKLMGKWRFFPIDTVEDFIAYYRALRKDQPYSTPHPKVLCLRFEDLVYEYDKTTAKLREFLHLPDNPHPKTVFDPDMSIANTQVFKRYPQFADDIKKIEEELSGYLFDFTKYPEPDFSKKMFLWSPLNKFQRNSYKVEGFTPQS